MRTPGHTKGSASCQEDASNPVRTSIFSNIKEHSACLAETGRRIRKFHPRFGVLGTQLLVTRRKLTHVEDTGEEATAVEEYSSDLWGDAWAANAGLAGVCGCSAIGS